MNRRELIQLVAATCAAGGFQMQAMAAISGAPGQSFRVRILRLDEPSRYSGIIYTTAAIGEAIKNPSPWGILGSLGVPDDGKVHLDRVSHTVKDLAIEDGWLVGTVRVLSTPMGKQLAALPSADFRVCGIGRVYDDQTVQDYRIVSINAHVDAT